MQSETIEESVALSRNKASRSEACIQISEVRCLLSGKVDAE
jgi:hypothetical protein